MAQCPSRAVGLDCVADSKVRDDGKCAFCGGVVGRPTDEPLPDFRGFPHPGFCYTPSGRVHLASAVFYVDGSPRTICRTCIADIYRRGAYGQ